MMRFYKLFHELKAKQFQGINRKDEQGNTILHLATWYASSDKTKFLIEQGGDINARNNKGETPLHIAVNKGKILHVKKIIDAGGDVNAKDNNEATPLHKAIMRIFKVNVKSEEFVYNKFIPIAETLIEAGADIYAKDKRGLTAVHYIKWVEGAIVVFMSYLNAQMKVEDEIKKKGREEKRKIMDRIMEPIMKEKVVSIESIRKGNEEVKEMIREINESLEEKLRTLGLTK